MIGRFGIGYAGHLIGAFCGWAYWFFMAKNGAWAGTRLILCWMNKKGTGPSVIFSVFFKQVIFMTKKPIRYNPAEVRLKKLKRLFNPPG